MSLDQIINDLKNIFQHLTSWENWDKLTDDVDQVYNHIDEWGREQPK